MKFAVGIYESAYIFYKIIYETCNYIEPSRCPGNTEHPKEKNATHSPHLRNISLFGSKEMHVPYQEISIGGTEWNRCHWMKRAGDWRNWWGLVLQVKSKY